MDTTVLPLHELQPHDVELKLSRVKETLTVRACNLADDAWAMKKFGMGIEFLIRKPPTIEQLIQVLFRLLTPESQEHFTKKSVKFVNDEGDSKTIEIGGADLLMHFIFGGKEVEAVGKAILESIGYSRPVIEEAEQELIKKKLHLERKSPPDGPRSSTSSPSNMDGQPSTSSAAV